MTEVPEKPKSRPWVRRAILVLAALWALIITALIVFRGGGHEQPAPPAAQPSPSPSESLTTAQVFQTLAPSVVLIQAAGGSSGSGAMSSSLGTGVIANADGSILTAFHVVQGAKSITVTFADGTKARATVADSDAAIDIAILVPEALPDVVVPATLGGGPAIGDRVVAIGNQLGLTDSTTDGVVSGLNRTVPRAGGEPLAGLIQFDAAVNPGSSGGPLINAQGQVVGIVVALANPTSAGTFIGVGFAVPIGTALGAGEGDGRQPPL